MTLFKKIRINTEYIKLDQFLKFTGEAETGGRSKEIIEKGVVFVNGDVCKQRGKKLKNGDEIRISDVGYNASYSIDSEF